MIRLELKNKKIVFLGDSITEGIGVSNPDNLYWNQIAKRTGAQCYGYGIGGTRIAPQHTPSQEDDQYFGSRISDMIPDADAIVVFGGTNDFGHGDAPLGIMSDRTSDTFYGALHTLYTSLICRYPCARIVILTPLHRCGEGKSAEKQPGTENLPLIRYVEAIREVAEYYALPVLDLFAMSGLQPNVPVIKKMYLPDGLHPNDTGHKRIAEMIVGFLQSLL